LIPAGAARASSTNEIVTLGQLMGLRPEPTGPGHPLRLTGVVLCCDPGWHQLYLYDGHETEYLNADEFSTHPEKGQWVEITGIARSSTLFEHLNLVVRGTTNLPPAKPMEFSQLAREHAQWVQVEGRVMSAETSRGRLALLLHGNGQNCLIYVLGELPTRDYLKLLDCKVRVRGINASKTIGGRLDSPMLFVPSMGEVTVIEPAAPKTPVPVVSIYSLLNRELGSWTNHWVHINGTIVTYEPGQYLVVKDPTGVIRARVIQLTEIPGDDRVDVWGFLQVSPAETFLQNAYFELAQLPSAPTPADAATNGPLESVDVLTNMASIRKMPRQEAAQHLPVRFRGVLTYADPSWRNGFIQEENNALYVDLEPSQKELQAGQWVELTGQTSAGGFAPDLVHSSIKVLWSTNLPSPARVDLGELANGQWDARWIEMEGIVRRVDVQSEHANLSVMTPEGQFRVIIPQFENAPLTNLIDALVSVQGACTSELNTRRQLSGITLHTPSLAQLRILEAQPADPFAISTRPIDSVATYDPERRPGRRVKVQGVVTLTMPDRGCYLQDASGGLLVLSRQTDQIQVGDLVEVLGFPAIGSFSPTLEEACFRQVGTNAAPAPKRTTAEQILLHGTNDCEVVEIHGQLLQSVPRSAHPQLVLQDGTVIFTANFEGQAGQLEVPALESGSRLRLTGVCAIQGGQRHEPVTFRMLLRSLGDIEVLETPPWWTSRHMFMLAGGLMLAVSLALAWAGMLRRQVRNQTEVIRQKLKEGEALEQQILEISNREQRRIGHDLHDGVCQQLAGIALLTSTLADELEEAGVAGATKAERISTLLNDAIDRTRGVARGLFPVRLEEKGLVFALEELAAIASELFKLNCRFVAENPPSSIGNAIAQHLYYIVLEAVANASKHGSAKNVTITLSSAGERCRLTVQDDGVGFARAASAQTGMGIRIMQYRARVIGASLSLRSQPGSGTTVTCVFIPVSSNGAGNKSPDGVQADKTSGKVYG
jgi:signal transduction histidine kinase